jgi:TolB protein
MIIFQKGLTTYVINANGSARRGWANYVLDADWSPDGASLVYDRVGTGIAVTGAPFVSFGGADTVNGTDNFTKLTSTPRDSAPTWSPDGRRIAFNGEPASLGGEAPDDVFVMNANGSARTNVTRTSKSETEPSWSPDGAKIIFHSEAVINNTDISAMNADGTGQTRLTTDAGSDIRPSWQPVNRRFDAQISEGTPPTILCGPGDRAWKAGDARIVCKPGARLPVEGLSAALG